MTYPIKTSRKGHLSPLFFIVYRKQMLDVEFKKAEPQTLIRVSAPRTILVYRQLTPRALLQTSLASDRLGRTTGDSEKNFLVVKKEQEFQMATKLGGFPYKSQSHLENIRRIGSQTFLLVCRQLGWRSCFTMLEGRVEREVEGHSGANLYVSW